MNEAGIRDCGFESHQGLPFDVWVKSYCFEQDTFNFVLFKKNNSIQI